MKAVRAHFEEGRITLSEPVPDIGPVDVLVVFPDVDDDPWERIIQDPVTRPELARVTDEIRAEISVGLSNPLKLEDL